ncbi:MAG: hypothetical protein AB1500_04265 [Bacillota bacterium]
MPLYRRPQIRPGRREAVEKKEEKMTDTPIEESKPDKSKELIQQEMIARLERIGYYQRVLLGKSEPCKTSGKDSEETGGIHDFKKMTPAVPEAEAQDESDAANGMGFGRVGPGIYSFKLSGTPSAKYSTLKDAFKDTENPFESALPSLVDDYRRAGKTNDGVPVYTFK